MTDISTKFHIYQKRLAVRQPLLIMVILLDDGLLSHAVPCYLISSHAILCYPLLWDSFHQAALYIYLCFHRVKDVFF